MHLFLCHLSKLAPNNFITAHLDFQDDRPIFIGFNGPGHCLMTRPRKVRHQLSSFYFSITNCDDCCNFWQRPCRLVDNIFLGTSLRQFVWPSTNLTNHEQYEFTGVKTLLLQPCVATTVIDNFERRWMLIQVHTGMPASRKFITATSHMAVTIVIDTPNDCARQYGFRRTRQLQEIPLAHVPHHLWRFLILVVILKVRTCQSFLVDLNAHFLKVQHHYKPHMAVDHREQFQTARSQTPHRLFGTKQILTMKISKSPNVSIQPCSSQFLRTEIQYHCPTFWNFRVFSDLTGHIRARPLDPSWRCVNFSFEILKIFG